MELKVLISVIIGILFVMGVCSYLYFMDKYDKESKRLLLLLFFAGVISGLLIFFLKEISGKGLILAFGNMVTVGLDTSLVFKSNIARITWTFINNFVVMSLVPILVKFIFAYVLTHKNKNFNSLFDGIIYLAYVFLGALLSETICYAILNGWDLFLFSLLTVACIDVFSAIIIGYYYTNWYTWKIASSVEEILNERKMIPEKNKVKFKTWILKGLAFGVIISTIYQYCGNKIYGLILVVAALIFAIRKVNDISRKDMADENLVYNILIKHYPSLSEKKEETINIINERTN